MSCFYLHRETKLLDTFFAVPGPWCWLVIITLKQIPPNQETGLAFVWPILHHLTEFKDMLSKTQEDSQIHKFIHKMPNIEYCLSSILVLVMLNNSFY